VKVCPSCSAHLEDSAEFCPFDGHRLVADTSDVSFIGATLADRWRVERKLGQGAVGTVYRAEDAGRPAAVKILNPAFGPGSEEVERTLA
jgi:serine/threonine-protein kinase